MISLFFISVVWSTQCSHTLKNGYLHIKPREFSRREKIEEVVPAYVKSQHGCIKICVLMCLPVDMSSQPASPTPLTPVSY